MVDASIAMSVDFLFIINYVDVRNLLRISRCLGKSLL